MSNSSQCYVLFCNCVCVYNIGIEQSVSVVRSTVIRKVKTSLAVPVLYQRNALNQPG